MKRIFTYILAFTAATAMLSCTREAMTGEDDIDVAEGLRITVKTSALTPTTKADTGHGNQTTEKAGEDDYNENLIKSVDYFLYNSNDLTTPVKKGRVDGRQEKNK